MSVLILLLVVIVIAAVACYAIDLVGLDPRMASLAKLLIIVIALVYMLTRSGLL